MLTSHWLIDKWVRMCDCGCDSNLPPKDVAPPLQVSTNGRYEYAHCPHCGKTWRWRCADGPTPAGKD